MGTELKILNGGLNLDDAYSVLPKGDYVDAINITHDAVQANEDGDITNIVGNLKVSYNYPSGDGTVIGCFAYNLRNTVIFMRYNSLGYNGVYEYNNTTRAITKIFECITDSDSDILGFTKFTKITSINIYPREVEGDLLYFLDGMGRPTMMNMLRFKAGEYTPVTRQIINVIKAPPLPPAGCVFGNDTSFNANYFKNKGVRFAYLYSYDEFEDSVFSPWSIEPLPVKVLDTTYTNVITNNNVVFISMNSGDKNVRYIKLLASIADQTNEWGDFLLVDTIDKSTILLSQTSSVSTSGDYNVSILFTGAVVTGTSVTIQVRRTSDGVILTAATYTTIAGDTISSVIAALTTSLNASGYLVGTASTSGNTLFFTLDNPTYTYSDTSIVNILQPDNIPFSYSFYNESTYPLYDAKRQVQLFDYVPDTAKCQEQPNGNVNAFASVTEGLSRDITPNVVNTVLTVAAGGGSPVGNLNVIFNTAVLISQEVTTFIFSGTPATGTVINIKYRRISDGLIQTVATYTTLGGNTSADVATNLAINASGSGLVLSATSTGVTLTIRVSVAARTFSVIEILPPSVGVSSSSTPTWKWSTSRNIGLQYFDQNGKTNGVLYSGKITFPAYAESGGNILLPYINTKIYHVPPIWAYSFTFLFTDEPTKWIFWESLDVKSDSDYLYFNVTGFRTTQDKTPTVAPVLNYSFTAGDRMRLIKNATSGAVFNATYDSAVEGKVTDPKISGTVTPGDFIKIKKVAPFSTVDFSSHFFVIELYTPGQSAANEKNKTFYECGLQYPIINPGTSDRVHGGMVTNQDISANIPAEFNIYDGDSYFRPRTIFLSDTGIATFFVQDRNFVDFYVSAVSSLQGRASEIDKDAKPTFFGALIRHSEAYQANTNINKLSWFPFENFVEVSAGYGVIERMVSKQRELVIMQTNKIGWLPLFSQIHRDPVGGNIVAQTDKLLNPVQYNVGDWGIGTASTSVISNNYSVAGVDNIRGAIWRRSNDGIDILSILFKVNSWANDNIPERTGDYNTYGAYDQRLSNFIWALEATVTSPAQTIFFDEQRKRFDSFVNLYPESICCLGTLFISFKDGNLWTHDNPKYNNFFGMQYKSSISPVFNDQNPIRKKYNAIGYQSKNNKIWYCPEIITNTVNPQTKLPQESSLIEDDFELEESGLTAALLFDKNSMADETEALLEGDFLGGNNIKIKFEISEDNAQGLVSLTQPYLTYELSNRNF